MIIDNLKYIYLIAPFVENTCDKLGRIPNQVLIEVQNLVGL